MIDYEPGISFEDWFKLAFKGLHVPSEFLEYLKEYPEGLSGELGSVWDAEEIIGWTEERNLHEQGVCLIGWGAGAMTHFLLGAKNGKIYIVDKHDISIVDATFSGMQTFINLMQFNLPD